MMFLGSYSIFHVLSTKLKFQAKSILAVVVQQRRVENKYILTTFYQFKKRKKGLFSISISKVSDSIPVSKYGKIIL